MRNGKVIVIILVCLIILFRGTTAFLSYQKKSFEQIIPLDNSQFTSLLFTQDYSNIGKDDLNPFMTVDIHAAQELVDFLSQYTIKRHWRFTDHPVDREMIAYFTMYHKNSKPISLFIYEDYVLTSSGNFTSYAILDGPIDREWMNDWEETYF